MFDHFKKASALRERLDTAEKLLLQQRSVADEIAKQRDQALNRAGAAEAKLKDAERELETAREEAVTARLAASDAEQAAQTLQQAKDTLAAQLEAKDDELKALADVHAKAETWEQAFRDVGRTLREVADAAGAGEGDDLVEVVRTYRATLERLKLVLGDADDELRDAAQAPSPAEDAKLQAPAEAVSVSVEPASAEIYQLEHDLPAETVDGEGRIVPLDEAELAQLGLTQRAEAEARA